MKNHVLKQNLSLFLLSGLLFIIPTSADAQIWKNLGKKLEEKVERQASSRLERKIDKAIDKGFDKVEETADNAVKSDDKKNESAGSGGSVSKGTPNRSTPVVLAPMYTFQLGVTYQILNEGKPMEMTMWLSEQEYIGMSMDQQKNIFMVIEGSQMISFMQKEKKYMSLGSGMTEKILGAAMEQAENDPQKEEFSIKKTGTESVLNHQCDVYEVTGPDYTTKLWLTRELGIKSGNLMSVFSGFVKSGAKFPHMESTAGGLLLKMESINEKNSVQMEAKKIHTQGLQFSTSEYSSIGF